MGTLTKLLGSLAGQIAPSWWRWVAYGTLILSAAALLVGWGYAKGSERLYAYQAEQARQAVVIVAKQGAATVRVVTKYVKVREAAQVVTNTIKEEVIRYVEKNPGSSCLDGRWGMLHDAAAAGAVPEATGGTDASPGAPTAAQTLETVTANYAACNRTADRLAALQEWVRAQAAVKP